VTDAAPGNVVIEPAVAHRSIGTVAALAVPVVAAPRGKPTSTDKASAIPARSEN
jgi:hypothetical protein